VSLLRIVLVAMMVVSLPLYSLRTEAKEVPKGSLVIAGGELRFDNRQVWERFVKLAGGKGATIAVIPAAARSPEKSGQAVVDHLSHYEVKAILVPIAPKWKEVDFRQAARDPAHVETLRKATGIWFIGGSQQRITEALLARDGTRTPALEAIWDAYRDGAVVGGSSAGAAMMSEWMFANAPDSLGALQFGVTRFDQVDKGLGFVGKDWFVDQHFLTRGRFARSLVAMRELGYKFGIGIDEDSAVVVKDGSFEVLGTQGAVVLDLSAAESDPAVVPFQMKRARLTYLDTGDRMDMRTHAVTLAKRKLEGQKIDPRDPGFKPEQETTAFVPDMLGSGALLSAMIGALESRSGEVKGLAFSPEGSKKTLGFEIKVYRAKDACGWYTARGGYDSYTVTKMLVDILPVEMAVPIYRPLKSK
jgi:cyanophycinase